MDAPLAVVNRFAVPLTIAVTSPRCGESFTKSTGLSTAYIAGSPRPSIRRVQPTRENWFLLPRCRRARQSTGYWDERVDTSPRGPRGEMAALRVCDFDMLRRRLPGGRLPIGLPTGPAFWTSGKVLVSTLS